MSKGLQHVAPQARHTVLGRVRRRGAGRGGAYGHGHGAARPVAGRRVGGAARLRLQSEGLALSNEAIGLQRATKPACKTHEGPLTVCFCSSSCQPAR